MEKRGMDFKVSVGGEFVGGQRGATLNQTTETMETTSKTSDGWRTYVPSFKEWSIDADGVLIASDEAFEALKTAYNNGEPVQVKLVDTDGAGYEGNCIIGEFPIEFPYDDLATYSVTLQGTGELVNIEAPSV